MLAVGGSEKFVEGCVSAAKAVGIRVSLTAHAPEILCKNDSGAGCFGILVPSAWIEKVPQLAAAHRDAKIFVAGEVTKEQMLHWCDAFTESRVFVVPGEPHKAVLCAEKVLRGTLVSAETQELAAPLSGDEIYRDTLTGCYTRRYLTERFPCGGHYSVVFIDLDNFKPVNDILGHEAGDNILKVFGQMLTDHLKGRDLAVRWGGDEFILVLPETTRGEAERVVENLRTAWKKVAPDTGNLEVRFSAGISSGRGNAGLQDAINEADRLMYAEKKVRKTREAWGPPKANLPAMPELPENVWMAAKKGLVLAVNIIAVVGMVFAVVWAADYAMQFFGGYSPYLHEAARVVEWFWKTVYAGLTGRAG